MAKSPPKGIYEASIEPESAYAGPHNLASGALPPTEAPAGTAANTRIAGTKIPSKSGRPLAPNG